MPDTGQSDGLLDAIQKHLPIALHGFDPRARRTGLVIVDEVNGFATVGAGNLAPPAPNPQVSRMVSETGRLARAFEERGWPMLAFLDTHVPGKPEPPYPPHCELGTGEENLVPELEWLEQARHATLMRKDCINGFVGAIRPDGTNQVVDWVKSNRLEAVLVVGICTDICVMDFVLTMLSARNHDLMPGLKDIVVYEGACSTYDLPEGVAADLGLPRTSAHPQMLTHHMGLYFMASRGAVLAGEVVL
ncbi:MAG TPA: isochorismatase family protein [Alphaproteobacteria bacterium]|nr:isochorismatase family protein [Alphaproteobacteria bacterium]